MEDCLKQSLAPDNKKHKIPHPSGRHDESLGLKVRRAKSAAKNPKITDFWGDCCF